MSNQIAQWIPAKARAAVYALLGALVALEAVWDLLDDGLETKLLSSLTVLGFGLAVSQTPVREAADDGE